MSEKEQAKKTLNLALLEAQRKITAVTKDGDNPHFKSCYPTLAAVIDAVKDALNSEGILIAQPVEYVGDAWCVVSRLTLAETGESAESKMPIVAKDMNDPQKWGSAITYARRYTLQSLVALPATDDDGNAAAAEPVQRREKAQDKKQDDQLAALVLEAKRELEAARKEHNWTLDHLMEYAKEQTGRELSDLDVKQLKTLTAKLIVGGGKG